MSTAPDARKTNKLGSVSTSFWLGLLVLSMIVFGANTGVATWQGSRLAGAGTGAADLQVLSQQLANQGREAVSGDAKAFAAFKETKGRIDSTVSELDGRYGQESSIASSMAQLKATWVPLSKNADQVIASEPAVLGLAGNAERFSGSVPQLQAQLNEVVRAMTVSGAPASQIYNTLQQVVVAGTMARRVTEMRAGGANAAASGDALARDSVVFTQMLEGLRTGNEELGIAAVRNPAALSALEQSQAQWTTMKKDVDAILASSRNLFAAQSSAAALTAGSGKMLDDSKKLFDAFSAFGSVRDTRLFPNFWLGVVSGLVALLAIIGFVWSSVRVRTREQDVRYQSQVEFNSRNQQAIMRLLDEISSLGEGDLTVKASVTEDMTGAIADAINYAVDELRHLVTTINDTSAKVAVSTQETQATAMQLAEAAGQQANQITTASERISEIAASIEQVSRNSTESAEVAQRSVVIAAEGAGVVRETIQGMDQIRDQIQETSKRIKRLGESSQEIGSIVELINDISEQTNILALNAAVQAASAGEAGRGFAVVADEVQRLAERTSSATRRIEGLVQTIQADTNEAVSSMEQTTSEVVSGARLAEDAGTALTEIERVSNALNNLIKNISIAAHQQSAAATDITQTMGVIRQITSQTSQGAEQTAESIGNLAQLAADLRRSVADFKLPA
ncbi:MULTISPECIES: methyl-accepting chemotaxis protein [Xanthomonas]|uniref:Methyl-accepting chemotaxis protein n=3 Tax=Xanthomonas phaseoli TaxID=1985254 RepID=A0A8I1XMW2_XANMN|nr:MULTISPECIES: methyl-accepting chemotaxis protein [Xanthomonas]MBO9737924.1 methyl-accepting chemotaxis protein [Xanthomonas axonopodis pv. begoniae]OQP78026.1 chemotaxis protein [Xanthomonas phaseoli pv. syngonii LMG 9055]RWU15538.1 methyl-accepting chemotaxis protein [Xanthomonas phaseoli pv. manihotis str. CIO151]KUF25126.1 chemotaxis protein [Xanthomonas phaseoli pv. manihotis]MBO9720655.1 methyl-accepting chemotaxis protein [Xanthomonas phaseoli pv. manihotis]